MSCHTRLLVVIVTCITSVFAVACGDESPPPPRNDGGADALVIDGASDTTPAGEGGTDVGTDATTGATLSIYIKGDLTPKIFSDGYAGQTPKVYTMGLGRFEIMTSAADPSPVKVFDHGATPVQVDLLSTTLGGQAPLAQLPAGSYTHGRVLLTASSFTIAATVHAGIALPGEIEVIAALSDTTIAGQAWKQGQASFTFKVGGVQKTIPGVLPALPSTSGGTVVQQGGQTWMVFPFPKPLVISPAAPLDHKATIIYMVFESFRWEDLIKAGFLPKVFDVDGLALAFEPVKNFGATGYAVLTE